ncbi:initiation of chromosome replication protein [Ligilactobacillus salitolerans]|uniref:Initiation of chromosome replication protein n=1 Tax=Ligilactobacillus salitolerans TaxID=1808352 RepID=A0A401IU88_9LACO|nr:DnaD domain protein [Ligilactobacillus salitolerans]GBG95101.1 initiation of chromosome replication protein [Ligilactobacillus salitolerans]
MEQIFAQYIKEGQMTVSNMVLRNYSKLGLTSDEFILFLQISSCLQSGKDFPDLDEIGHRMGIKNTEVYDLVHQLLAKKLLTLVPVSDASGKQHDRYSFELLYRKLSALLEKQGETKKDINEQMQREQVYNQIEEEFGHPLSPIEMETIDSWLKHDHYSAELISAALREAVLGRAYSLKYMDKVLLNWEKHNIKSAADVEALQSKRRKDQGDDDGQGQAKKRGQANQPHIPLYQWSQRSDSKLKGK